jgi:hypothetical protein
MYMLPIHWRMAELTVLQERRGLTMKELDELDGCLAENANYARELANLYNLSGIASATDDMEWLHEVCAEIDQLEIQYKTKSQ